MDESINRFERSIKHNASPISPLSPEILSCNSIDLAIDDTIHDSIELLDQNICDMESSNGNDQRTLSFITNGNKSRTDSELHHLVQANIDTEEVVKDVVMVENKEISRVESSPTKKSGKASKGTSSRVKSRPSAGLKVEGMDNEVKCIATKPPFAKRNMIKSSTNSNLSSSSSSCVNKKSKCQKANRGDDGKKGSYSLDMGPYLLKKAKDMLSYGDNYDKAYELILRAKKSFENCNSKKPSLDYVMCLHILASIYCSMGQPNEAIPILERSIKIPKIKLGLNHALAKFVGCMQLGDIYAMQGQIEKSIIHYKCGLEIQKQALGEQNPRFGETCRYVAEAHVQAFEFDEAEKLCQMALDVHKANDSSISIEEAADRRLMGLICDSKGNFEAALTHYVLARTIMIPSNVNESDVAAIECNIGDAYLALARYDEAALSYQKALAAFKSSKDDNHPAIALVFVRLAELYNKVGMFGESQSYCEKALLIYNKPHPDSSVEDIASGLIDLSTIYVSMNELDQALQLLHKVLEMYEERSDQQCMIAGIETRIGVIQYMLENYDDSYNHLQSSILKFQASGEKKSAIYGIILNQLGLACVQLYEISEAAKLFEEARSILEKKYGPYHPDTLGVYKNLASTYDALGRWEEAIELLEFVVRMREEKLGTADPVVDDEKMRLSKLLKEAGSIGRKRSRSLETLFDTNSHTRLLTIAGVKI